MSISSNPHYLTRSNTALQISSLGKRKADPVSILAEEISVIASDQTTHFNFLDEERRLQEDKINSLRNEVSCLKGEIKKINEIVNLLTRKLDAQTRNTSSVKETVEIMQRQGLNVIKNVERELTLSKLAIREIYKMQKR
ncbi:MAG: hypothetical protein JSS09_08955 [Verrucomicrobia bacterium]|nr:hypothetical protein [Verrucomicrobiota bacterium]